MPNSLFRVTAVVIGVTALLVAWFLPESCHTVLPPPSGGYVSIFAGSEICHAQTALRLLIGGVGLALATTLFGLTYFLEKLQRV